MKKLFIIFLGLMFCSFLQISNAQEIYSVRQLKKMGIVANSSLEKAELEKAKGIIKNLQAENAKRIKIGYGPFLAVVYDDKGNVVAKMSNTVIKECNSNCHAEMNTIKLAEQNLKTFDLGKKNLTMYVTAEPCVMCMGAIMWSGIDRVFYSVSSADVEALTGFDEGYKPHWQNALKKRGIKVYGNIETDLGKKVLTEYKNSQKIYMPSR